MILTVLLILLIHPGTGRAQPASAPSALHHARTALAAYDPEDLPTVVAELTTLLRPGADRRVQHEARWLRAAATVDAWTIAASLDAPTLNARLARAYGVSTAQLVPTVRADLLFLSAGAFSDSAEATLRTLESLGDALSSRRPDGGMHGTLLWLEEIAEDLQATSDSTAALAAHFERLGDVRPLTERYLANLDQGGQWAVHTLEAAIRSRQRFDEQVGSRAPLALALRSRFDNAWRVIREVVIRPGFQMDLDLGEPIAPRAATGGPRARLIVALSSGQLRWALTPTLHIDAQGKVVPTDRRWPTYPDMREVALARQRTLAAVPLEGLGDILRAEEMPAGAWHLAVASDVSALLFAQALIAADHAGRIRVRLLGRTRDGQLATVPITVGELPRARPTTDVRLRVHRLGFRVASIWGSAQVPNVARAGRLTHDHRGLGRILAPFPIRSAMLRFHGNLRSQAILGAVWRVAPENGPVVLVPERATTH